jgi:methyl-accepting chemotaxis protein
MNNILNKIAQMERNAEEIKLATHKVELSLIDDVISLQKMVKERISLIDKATNEINKTIALKDKLISEAKTTLNVLNTNTNEVNLLIKQITQSEVNLTKVARELNLNVREIPEMKMLLDLKTEMTNKFKNELAGKQNLLDGIIKQ